MTAKWSVGRSDRAHVVKVQYSEQLFSQKLGYHGETLRNPFIDAEQYAVEFLPRHEYSAQTTLDDVTIFPCIRMLTLSVTLKAVQ